MTLFLHEEAFHYLVPFVITLLLMSEMCQDDNEALNHILNGVTQKSLFWQFVVLTAVDLVRCTHYNLQLNSGETNTVLKLIRKLLQTLSTGWSLQQQDKPDSLTTQIIADSLLHFISYRALSPDPSNFHMSPVAKSININMNYLNLIYFVINSENSFFFNGSDFCYLQSFS